jgi:hypothetical protein
MTSEQRITGSKNSPKIELERYSYGSYARNKSPESKNLQDGLNMIENKLKNVLISQNNLLSRIDKVTESNRSRSSDIALKNNSKNPIFIQ